MATLNLKDFPAALYLKIQARARENFRSVTQEVLHILTRGTEPPPRESLLTLRGLGKDLWKDVDARVHVRAERGRWD